MSRTVDANDGTGPHTWNYQWKDIDYTDANIVTDPLLNDTAHTPTGLGGTCSLYVTKTQHYQGSRASGILLKTENTDYSFSPNPFDFSHNSVANVFTTRTTTVYPNGQTSKVERDYDPGFIYRDPLYGLSVYAYYMNNNNPASYGKVTAEREYDLGPGAPGALLRTTNNTYLWQSNSNHLEL